MDSTLPARTCRTTCDHPSPLTAAFQGNSQANKVLPGNIEELAEGDCCELSLESNEPALPRDQKAART
jgi:hypothetical protein